MDCDHKDTIVNRDGFKVCRRCGIVLSEISFSEVPQRFFSGEVEPVLGTEGTKIEERDIRRIKGENSFTFRRLRKRNSHRKDVLIQTYVGMIRKIGEELEVPSYLIESVTYYFRKYEKKCKDKMRGDYKKSIFIFYWLCARKNNYALILDDLKERFKGSKVRKKNLFSFIYRNRDLLEGFGFEINRICLTPYVHRGIGSLRGQREKISRKLRKEKILRKYGGFFEGYLTKLHKVSLEILREIGKTLKGRGVRLSTVGLAVITLGDRVLALINDHKHILTYEQIAYGTMEGFSIRESYLKYLRSYYNEIREQYLKKKQKEKKKQETIVRYI